MSGLVYTSEKVVCLGLLGCMFSGTLCLGINNELMSLLAGGLPEVESLRHCEDSLCVFI